MQLLRSERQTSLKLYFSTNWSLILTLTFGQKAVNSSHFILSDTWRAKSKIWTEEAAPIKFSQLGELQGIDWTRWFVWRRR